MSENNIKITLCLIFEKYANYFDFIDLNLLNLILNFLKQMIRGGNVDVKSLVQKSFFKTEFSNLIEYLNKEGSTASQLHCMQPFDSR